MLAATTEGIVLLVTWSKGNIWVKHILPFPLSPQKVQNGIWKDIYRPTEIDFRSTVLSYLLNVCHFQRINVLSEKITQFCDLCGQEVSCFLNW